MPVPTVFGDVMSETPRVVQVLHQRCGHLQWGRHHARLSVRSHAPDDDAELASHAVLSITWESNKSRVNHTTSTTVHFPGPFTLEPILVRLRVRSSVRYGAGPAAVIAQRVNHDPAAYSASDATAGKRSGQHPQGAQIAEVHDGGHHRISTILLIVRSVI